MQPEIPRRVFVAAAAALVLFAGSPRASALEPADLAHALVATQTTPPKVPVPPPKVTAAGRCASLEQQFATAVLLHLTAKKVAAARKLAEDGSEDCTAKKYSLGTRRLVAALAMLGITPKL